LGTNYEFGRGAKIDHKTAALWFRRAAEQGYPEAQANLGLMFYNGKGVAQSYDEAARWYRLAAAQGWADALYYLGECYVTGLGATGLPRGAAPPQARSGQGVRRRCGGGRTARGAPRGDAPRSTGMSVGSDPPRCDARFRADREALRLYERAAAEG
jgi:TPR repeat protein